ncbi:MAG: phenylalanine 4-monooxygenase [Anaerolineae bacterium]|nr:phenylalanine 4-monooxygenase [Gemmatimonadaceae bacterium]
MLESLNISVPSSSFIDQDWDSYTEEDHAVWGLLYARRMSDLERNGSRLFLEGASALGLRQDRVPDLSDVNRLLAGRTGWCAVPVSGFLPPRQFFDCLALRRFPTTVKVRPRAQLDYLPEPDIFHDVFGHVPLHANPEFAGFLQRFGEIAVSATTPDAVERMARLFWFTVEFGLINEAGHTRVYGSGLISSAGDCANALSGNCERRPFSLEGVMAQPYVIDQLQDVLFVVDSFQQLFHALDDAAGLA